MVSPFSYILKPFDGERYANKRKSGLIVSANIEDHLFTQRLAEVVATPFATTDDTNVKVGDIVVVHHNVFRKFLNEKGNEEDGMSFIRDNIFLASADQMYLAKTGDEEWRALSPYAFVSPIKNDDRFTTDIEKSCVGVVEYSALIDKGTVVSFQPNSEYEFVIDGRKMYRMYNRNICLKL